MASVNWLIKWSEPLGAGGTGVTKSTDFNFPTPFSIVFVKGYALFTPAAGAFQSAIAQIGIVNVNQPIMQQPPGVQYSAPASFGPDYEVFFDPGGQASDLEVRLTPNVTYTVSMTSYFPQLSAIGDTIYFWALLGFKFEEVNYFQP